MKQTQLLTTILLGCSGQALLSGCSTQHQALEIRPVGKAAVAVAPGAAGIAQAYGMLRLGNAGTALEAFRKIQRDTPSAEALAGIAECYVAMGRDDVAKSKYEEALALAPNDARLLQSVALVMDRMGMHAEAALARGQADALMPVAPAAATQLASATAPATMAQAGPAPVAITAPPPAASSVAIASAPKPMAIPLAIAAPAPRAAPVAAPAAPTEVATAMPVPQPRAAIEAVRPAATPVAAPEPKAVIAAPPPAPVATSAPVVVRSADVAPPAPAPAIAVAQASSLTVKLPPARPVDREVAMAASAKRTAPATPAAETSSPRLERISPTVVALVTSTTPLWTPSGMAQAARAAAVKWEPLRAAVAAAPVWQPLRTASREVNVRILNAARLQGLARAARMVLTERGWRKIEVADHNRREARSIVYYPADRRKLGKSLAAQFGIRSREVSDGVLTVVLGSDMGGRLGR